MTSFEEKRAHPRAPSSARIRWQAGPAGEIRVVRLGDISLGGARVLTRTGPEVGQEVRFDVLDETDTRIAVGVACVVWARPSEGEVGISFLSLGVDGSLVRALALHPAGKPPPLPGATSNGERPARRRAEIVDVSTSAEEISGDRESRTPRG